MDRDKLDKLRAKYADAAPGKAHDPQFEKIAALIFAGSDRRPKPYEGVPTFLGAPLRLDARELPDFGGLDAALIGVPMDPRRDQQAGRAARPSVIAVSGVSGKIRSISVGLDGLTHDYPDDLDIFSSGPAGRA